MSCRSGCYCCYTAVCTACATICAPLPAAVVAEAVRRCVRCLADATGRSRCCRFHCRRVAGGIDPLNPPACNRTGSLRSNSCRRLRASKGGGNGPGLNRGRERLNIPRCRVRCPWPPAYSTRHTLQTLRSSTSAPSAVAAIWKPTCCAGRR